MGRQIWLNFLSLLPGTGLTVLTIAVAFYGSMTNKTSNSSHLSPILENGATDSPWQPSWWRWLISALSGTVEIERLDALEEQRHAQRMSELQAYNAELKKSNAEQRIKNKKLAKLESKLNEILHS